MYARLQKLRFFINFGLVILSNNTCNRRGCPLQFWF